MGILRTTEISGLETPTPVTGSVVFDGTGDYLDIGAFHISDSWTMEFWFNTSVNNTIQRPMNFSSNLGGTNYAYIELTSGGKIKARVASAAAFGETPAVTTNEWHHTALSYDGSTAYFVYDGKLIATQSVSYSNNSIQVRFGADESNASSNLFTGYVSNARILSGIALYTTDYTVPVHKLEKIDGTVLLCCNNPDSAGAEETGKTITVNGDAAASTFSPGLTRDFTYGTQFQGVAKFDTQGYFVPPSGTTEQRGRGRGVLQIGTNSGTYTTSLNYIDINSSGISQDFGDQSDNIAFRAGFSSGTRGVWSGGTKPVVGNMNSIEFVTLSTTGNALDFGNLDIDLFRYGSGASSSTRGVIMGGYQGSGAAGTINTIQYVTIASRGDTQDFGDLQNKRLGAPAFSSPTRALVAGGFISPANINSIEYIIIATTGSGTEFGDTVGNLGYYASGGSDGTRGVFGGGDNSGIVNTLQYVTIASTGNAQDFGDLTTAREFAGNAGATSKTRVAFCGGGDWPAGGNTIDYITIQSTGNAIHFGDISSSNATPYGVVAVSDSHGGLS